MATRVWQSTVVNAPLDKVWSIVRPLDFVWNPLVSTVDLEGKDSHDTVGGVRTVWYQHVNKEKKIEFTQQKIRLTELSDMRNEVSWEVVSSDPPISVMSQVHTIRLRRVTENNTTFVEWTTDFSKDASNDVIEDARYKQKENFAGLLRICANKFNYRSTAEDVINGCGVNVQGKVVIITGANSGVGLETTRVFAKNGAHVIAAVRDVERSEKVFQPLREQCKNGKIETMKLDLNSLRSVREFAAAFLNKKINLNYLICNAGIMATAKRNVTEEKIEQQFGVNHVAHHLLVTLLLDCLRKSAPARIVVLSSHAHLYYLPKSEMQNPNKPMNVNFDDYNCEEQPYNKWMAYAQSKFANVAFVKHLSWILEKEGKEGSKVEVFSVHPGAIFTNLGSDLDDTDRAYMLNRHYRWKTVQQGAATTVYAALSPDLAGKSGCYCSDSNIFPNNERANDAALCKKLWDITEKLIK